MEYPHGGQTSQLQPGGSAGHTHHGPPSVPVLSMSASTIVVALNAQVLRRLKLNPAQVR